MTTPELPSFDLVVASVDRSAELERFLRSLEAQTHAVLRVLLVDQNEDDRLEQVVAKFPGLEILHLRSSRGLSRARNVGLEQVTGDVVAFPDDDCVYPEDLVERAGLELAARGDLAGLSGRVVDSEGRASPNWSVEPAILERDNLWNRVNSAALFLRIGVVRGVGGFDERLGLGSGAAWSSGEEIDYVVRALANGARIAYDPSLLVIHTVDVDGVGNPARGFRDGASVGYVLRKHRYPRRVVTRMLVRPAGGVVLSLVRRDLTRARFHAANLRGRVRGYLRRSSPNSSA